MTIQVRNGEPSDPIEYYLWRKALLASMQGNAREQAARVVCMYQTVHDVCRRNGMSHNDARMILERIHHDEEQDRKFTKSLKRELSARGVKV